MLAATSLGAIWSSARRISACRACSTALARSSQVLVCVDGYWYNGKPVDCLAKNAEVAAQMPSLVGTVVVPYLNPQPAMGGIAQAVCWNDIPASASEVVIKRVAFDHPLFIMFSSGTTGVPKCIVHCHGGACCNTSRSTSCIATCVPVTGCSTSPPAAG